MDQVEQNGLKPQISFKDFFKDKFNIAIVFVVCIAVLFLAVGAGLFLFKGSEPGDDIKIIEASSSVARGEIFVHVDGAINKPGVYKLAADSRINDAVSAAGGLSSDADSARINLAAKLADGQKVYVARISDPVSSRTKSQLFGSSDPVSSEAGLVSINSASESELDTLPGVGPVTAGKIINGRPYSSVDDLKNKKIVNSSTFEKIRDLVGI